MGMDYDRIFGLSLPEIRVLLEGERVDTLIESMVQEIGMEHGGDASRASGRTVPRPSDEALLQKHASGAASGASTATEPSSDSGEQRGSAGMSIVRGGY